MDSPLSYPGSKPYIFISYSHANMDQILPIIARLQRDGFRIWYDGDIESGGEWSDIICEHVDNCRGFIAFISRQYLVSEHCKDELSRIKKNKNATRVLVYLDNSELTGGMALNNERYQSIRWNSASPENSFAKLYTARGLAVCNTRGAAPVLQHAPEPYGSASQGHAHAYARPRLSLKKLLPILLGAALAVALLVAVPRLVRNVGSGAGTVNKALNATAQRTGGSSEQTSSAVPTAQRTDGDAKQSGSFAPDSVIIPIVDEAVPLGTDGVKTSDGSGVPLTSITEPVEKNYFKVRQDVTNTLGVTYKDAAVLFGTYSEPYVRYYVGDYSLLQGKFSVPQDVSTGNEFTLTVYLDDNETAPLPGYDRLELTRSSLEQSFSFDVSGANFITFALKPKDGSAASGIMLTDCYLYTDAASAPSQAVSSGQNPVQDGKPLVSITEPAEQRNFSVRQDVTNTLGVTYKDAAVLFGTYSEPYVRYYVGDYSLLQGKFSIPNEESLRSGTEFTLTVYLDDNEASPLPGYDRLELSRSTPEQSFSFDVSGANFITFALKPKDGSVASGIMLTDCYLYQ